MNILIMEDDPIYMRIFIQLYSSYGKHVVRTAMTLGDADKMRVGFPLDLVISDYELPEGRKGTECFKEIREQNPGVKIILVSGKDPKRIPPGHGADDFVQKGSNMVPLLRAKLDEYDKP